MPDNGNMSARVNRLLRLARWVAILKARSWPRIQRVFAIIMLIFFLPFTTSAEDSGKATSDSLIFTGTYRLRMQTNTVTGSIPQYNYDTELQPGTQFIQGLALSGFGPLGGGWYLNGRFNDAAPVAERFELRINRAANELFGGTRRFVAPSAGLLQWGRLITGVQASAITPDSKYGLRVAIGDPLGIPARDELVGRGLVGPYLIDAHHLPVVPESDTVSVDGLPLQRDRDYEIDYELGGITFQAPVPESSHIEVEYEYQAPQPRRTSVVFGRWQEKGLTMDILAGEEHETGVEDDNPLEYIPPDGASNGENEELPARQHMEGAALTWSPAPGVTLTGSWLGTSAVSSIIGDTGRRVAAYHTGGDWRGTRGRAGWDYRVIPEGFRPIGRTTDDTGYATLSSGYEYQLSDQLHSKLNVLWRRSLPLSNADPGLQNSGALQDNGDLSVGGALPLQGQAEHVLTYIGNQGTLGLSVGVTESQAAQTDMKRFWTSGLLANTRVGAWQLEAERRGVVASNSGPKLGEILLLSRFAANLTKEQRVSGGLQWKQDVRAGFTNADDEQVTEWRATLASKNSGVGAVLPDTHQVSWRLQWLQNDTQPAWNARTSSIPSTYLSFGRGEASVPLGGKWSGSLLAENRYHSGPGYSNVDQFLKTGLNYSERWNWDAYTSVQNNLGMLEPLRHQLAMGTQLQVPLKQSWSYIGTLDGYREANQTDTVTGIRSVQGVAWSKFNWRLALDWTAGLLQVPVQPDEDSDDTTPLAQLPVGRRFGFQASHQNASTQYHLQLARDLELHAGAWRGELQVKSKLGDNEVTGQINGVERRGIGVYSLRETMQLGVQWWLSPSSLMHINGRGDIRLSDSGIGDYRSVGVFTEWTTRF